MGDRFVCPDCGGDPVIADIARRMGHRPDIAFAAVRRAEEKVERLTSRGIEDMQHEIESLRAKVAELEKERDALIAVGRRMYEMPTDRHTYAVLDVVREMVKNAAREAEGGE